MRLWSLHPKHLDSKGLVALWREGLLAKHVLEGKSKGYNNHPQLDRFKSSEHPMDNINQYLIEVFQESERRGFHFDKNKINWQSKPSIIEVTTGQIAFETAHLLAKLEKRDYPKYTELIYLTLFEPHPLFSIVEGEIEHWEKTRNNFAGG